ncbi:5-oxoprolinase subunit PxpA [Coraliomargarita akajimensis]|uniref:LamB/YcsF family protein n=1 Tax=Coraliomargarita akajimensis (strain DSM 45221 / IAM 15411 / JCM 23193 / KCTC 12865 / 04OKA010-24) TaxID=583355 RepID=D5EIJ1_CORAD|nr:5-oxoprolinase subunit PxpA [Coraliomargarita akajimensis]ADE54257.1 LamB/YcsF family protein [Coraliomargarita akajimensis DSM 45221]
MGILLNCDLGENEPTTRTAELLALVDAANICCGVHAGSAAKTRETIGLAKRAGVLIGVHPGMAAAGGRGAELPDPVALSSLLREQCGFFAEAAAELDASIHHIKLHGSLYSAVEQDEELAQIYADVLRDYPDWKVFSLANGTFGRRAASDGHPVVGEIFADRAYLDNGALMPRSQAGALIEDVELAVERFRNWLVTRQMQTGLTGSILLDAETVCVHSDSPNALELLRKLQNCKKS